MTKFVRIKTVKEGVRYLNIATILEVRPIDKKSMDSGAEVEVGGIDSTFTYLIEAGRDTSRLMEALELRE